MATPLLRLFVAFQPINEAINTTTKSTGWIKQKIPKSEILNTIVFGVLPAVDLMLDFCNHEECLEGRLC